MYRIILVLLCFFLSTSAFAALYQYIDEKGNVNFSDTPIPGGKQIKQNQPSVAPAPKRMFNKQPEKEKKPTEQKSKKAERYKFVKISSPGDDKPLRSNNGDVTIVVNLSPKLQTKFKHKLKLKMDGKTLKNTWSSNTISLKSVDRGTHKISVIVVDNKGKKLKQSKTSTFHLLRHSRLFAR